jgi:hypothetical protein
MGWNILGSTDRNTIGGFGKHCDTSNNLTNVYLQQEEWSSGQTNWSRVGNLIFLKMIMLGLDAIALRPCVAILYRRQYEPSGLSKVTMLLLWKLIQLWMVAIAVFLYGYATLAGLHKNFVFKQDPMKHGVAIDASQGSSVGATKMAMAFCWNYLVLEQLETLGMFAFGCGLLVEHGCA